MKALIKVGYGCNDHCTFCHTLDVRHVDGTAEEVERKIERASRLGHTMVVLSGGEPTIRPELLRWAARVASLDMDFGLVTNGRMLSYPELVDQLVAHRLRYVYLSLHGGTARVHNLMVRSEAFEQTYAALTNLCGRGIDVTANCVITRHNVDHLRELVSSVLAYPDLVLKLSMVEPKGGGDALFEHLMPRIADVAEKVRDAIDWGEARVRETGAAGPRFEHGAIPLCLMRGYEDRYSDLKTHRFWTMIEVGEPDFFPVDDLNKVQPEESCAGCALRGPCPGLYRGYYEVYGAGELAKIQARPRSNAFHWVYEGLIEAPVETCPLRDGPLGVTPWDRGRHLFVRREGRVARFRTESRDFSDAEIEAVKHETGQVYLDVSRKPAPDDFARDLVKLERSALCDGCSERQRCTGMFEARLEDVFSEDDARVRALLGELEGDVLDVGCGEGPYEDVLAPLARGGRIRYAGIDPDEARIATLRTRWPWATLEVGEAETVNGAHLGRFDHVLVLRSWNHLRDPQAAIERIVDAMKPRATLTVVDNVAFGLARTRAQVDRAERGPARFEHYRNDTAEDAHRIIARPALRLLERLDVTPTTSNQWLLRYCVA